jgi:hypothetical protein
MLRCGLCPPAFHGECQSMSTNQSMRRPHSSSLVMQHPMWLLPPLLLALLLSLVSLQRVQFVLVGRPHPAALQEQPAHCFHACYNSVRNRAQEMLPHLS